MLHPLFLPFFRMPRSDNLFQLPPNLPIPQDDGACNHLSGAIVPSLTLPATDGSLVNLALLPGRTVIYAYPRTGEPDRDPPDGWDLIPGARGCTPQSCSFRDHYQELQTFGARVFGLSTQNTTYQQEAANRLHLPFPLLSDQNLRFALALRLPTFVVGDSILFKRVTFIVNNGQIEKVFYPVFPPDKNAEEVIAWLETMTKSS